MACLIILHNWFPVTCRGFMVAIWQASYEIIPIIKAQFYPTTSKEYYVSLDC